MEEQSFDYIIIGSGFGGSVAALRLVEKGYSVLVLEKGKRYNAEDFPRTNWNLAKYLWLPGLFCYGFQKLTFNRQTSILSGVGVGGGSLVYANTLFHPPDSFFEHISWKRFKNWKQILSPFYQKADTMMGRVKYNNLNAEDKVLKEIAIDFGLEESFDTVNVGVYLGDTEKETDPYFNGAGPKRKGCTECGGCMVGCRENAKNSLDKNYLFFAQKQGAGFNIIRILKLLWITITHPVAFFRTVFNMKWSTGLIIFLVMQHIENYMQFRLKRGLFGRRLKVINKGQHRVPAYIDIGQKVMESYAEKTKGVAQNIILEILFNRPTTAHILGGCPMSENIKEGVIDDLFRVHGYPDMYVVDGFAMQGNPGVNPSFSILAMAEYAMDQIPAKDDNHVK